jgi:hypothetical protein
VQRLLQAQLGNREGDGFREKQESEDAEKGTGQRLA